MNNKKNIEKFPSMYIEAQYQMNENQLPEYPRQLINLFPMHFKF